MGLLEHLERERRQQRRHVLQEMDKRDEEAVARPMTKAKLIITPLDSHRRELFAAFPSGGNLLTRETVDECKAISLSRKIKTDGLRCQHLPQRRIMFQNHSRR